MSSSPPTSTSNNDVVDLDWPPPLDPTSPSFPPPPSTLVGARTDGELAAALSLADSRAEPTFVLFGSSWCSHCHEMLCHFDSVRRTAYKGFDPNERDSDRKRQENRREEGGPLQTLLSGLGRLFNGSRNVEGEEVEGATTTSTSTSSSSPRQRSSGGRGRFVAARVDFMQSSASHVRFTPTVSIYRGRGKRKAVVDGFHGGDARRLADRAWLHLGGGRRRWGWC